MWARVVAYWIIIRELIFVKDRFVEVWKYDILIRPSSSLLAYGMVYVFFLWWRYWHQLAGQVRTNAASLSHRTFASAASGSWVQFRAAKICRSSGESSDARNYLRMLLTVIEFCMLHVGWVLNSHVLLHPYRIPVEHILMKSQYFMCCSTSDKLHKFLTACYESLVRMCMCRV